MKSFRLGLVALISLVPASAHAQRAYITNSSDNTVSVIDTTTNMVIGSPIPVGTSPLGVAVSPDGSKVYVTNHQSNTVSVIDTLNNAVIGSPIPVDLSPFGVAVTPDGSKVYVANSGATSVSVIDTATNTVSATITVGSRPTGVAATPDGSKIYVTHETFFTGTVSVIDTATDTLSSTIPVGSFAFGVAVTPDGSKVYLTHIGNNIVSVIDTATKCTMSWTEREGPPVPAPERRGFGTIVMEAMTERSVDGTVDLDYAPSGVIWRLTCPATNAVGSRCRDVAARAVEARDQSPTDGITATLKHDRDRCSCCFGGHCRRHPAWPTVT